MPRRAPIDVLRSVSRHLWVTLGDEWTVALPEQEGVFDRPFASVLWAGEAIPTPQGPNYVEYVQPFAIHAYPTVGKNEEESLLFAGEAEELLHQGFSLGRRGQAFPARMPLWDYEGVDMDTPAADHATPPYPGRRARAGDFAIVRNFNSRIMQDDGNKRLHFVAATLRLGWRRKAAPDSDGVLISHATPVSIAIESAFPSGTVVLVTGGEFAGVYGLVTDAPAQWDDDTPLICLTFDDESTTRVPAYWLEVVEP